MDFSNFNKDEFYTGKVPLKDILKGSAYYPACCDDGFPIKVCNMVWSSFGINSFVYCDFAFTREEVKHGALGYICGYVNVAERWLTPEEYIPQDWQLNLYGAPEEQYLDRRVKGDPDVEHFAVWRIYKREQHKDEMHGPEYMSFLFVGGEGFATYHQLYCANMVAPKVLFFVQYCDMIGVAPDWESTQSAFHGMFKANHDCAPEWVASGDHGCISYAIRVWNMEELGAKTLGYTDGETMRKIVGEDAQYEPMDCPPLRGRVSRAVLGDRVFLIICYNCFGEIIYEIIDKNVSCEELLQQMVKREVKDCSLNRPLLYCR